MLEERFESRGGTFTEKPTLGRDMWNQLQRVSIPKFNGDKKTYEGGRQRSRHAFTKLRPHPNISYFNLGSIYPEKLLRS